MKRSLYYFFAIILIFCLNGCSLITSKTSETNDTTKLMILKDTKIENIKLLKSQTNKEDFIITTHQTSDDSLIKEIVRTIKDSSPVKLQLSEKEKKSLNTEMEVNFKNGSTETLFILINDKKEISVIKESGEGYKLKEDAPKLVVDFFFKKEANL
ncbi:hypothetical protein SAMN04488168_104125 [Bacillus sp. 491mf]|uniref:hypothetical protein n=1 Tax=Bacillus TaxID=1386 RepID=UPI000554D5D2|nr:MULTISPECIES: hypothetical protein [unclassified Bacillus (in: firmicutes)]SFC39385.1 hypothetical protein SAMN04488168_104125 [Bacillus sp. 491mf]